MKVLLHRISFRNVAELRTLLAVGSHSARIERLAVDRRYFFCFLLRGQVFDLFHQRVNDLRFGDFSYHFPFFKDETDALAASDSEIGGARLPGPVDLATHNRNVDVKVAVGTHSFLDRLCQTDEIHISSPTRRTGDKSHPVFLESKASENFCADSHFLYRIGSQRNTYGITDSFRKKGPEAHRRLDCTDSRGARLRHTEMEWIIHFIGEHAVSFDSHQRV